MLFFSGLVLSAAYISGRSQSLLASRLDFHSAIHQGSLSSWVVVLMYTRLCIDTSEGGPNVFFADDTRSLSKKFRRLFA